MFNKKQISLLAVFLILISINLVSASEVSSNESLNDFNDNIVNTESQDELNSESNYVNVFTNPDFDNGTNGWSNLSDYCSIGNDDTHGNYLMVNAPKSVDYCFYQQYVNLTDVKTISFDAKVLYELPSSQKVYVTLTFDDTYKLGSKAFVWNGKTRSNALVNSTEWLTCSCNESSIDASPAATEGGLFTDNQLHKVTVIVYSTYADAILCLDSFKALKESFASGDSSFTINESDNYTYIVTLRDAVNGSAIAGATVIPSINGEEWTDDYPITDENGQITITPNTKGIINITVSYEGDDYYSGTNASKSFVIPVATKFVAILNEGTLNVTLKDEYENPISSSIYYQFYNDKTFTFVDTDENGSVFLNVTKGKGYVFHYLGNLNKGGYYDVAEDCTVFINYTTSLSSSLNDIKDSVILKLVDENNNSLSNEIINCTINGGETVTVTTNDTGEAIVDVNDIKGNFTVAASYAGNEEKYYGSSETNDILFMPFDTVLSIDLNEDNEPVVSLKDEDGNVLADKTITYNVNGGNNQTLITNSTGEAIIGDLSGGKSIIVAIFNGDDVYFESEAVNVTIIKINNTVTETVDVPVLANASIKLSDVNGSSVDVVLTDLDGTAIANATLGVVINGESSNITTDSEGKANIPVTANATVDVTYTTADGANVTSSITIINNTVTEFVNVTPNKTGVKLVFNKTMNTYVVLSGNRNGENFTVQLTDEAGNPLANKTLKIGFNGKVYNKTTDENGIARLQINIGYQSANTFSITFLGDDEYEGTVDCAIIVVKTLTTKMTASKSTYKSTAKTKKLTATLKYGSTALQGKKVTFKVNGQYYIATTNSKGVATVKVTLSTKKTYSYTATFDGDNQYSKVTATNKVVIK